MNKYLLVGLGGMIGAVARCWVCTWISNTISGNFPMGLCL